MILQRLIWILQTVICFPMRGRSIRELPRLLAVEVVEGNGHGYFVKGRVLVGTANPKMLEGYIEEDDMIIMGDREEDHLQAISQNVSCIIVGLNIVVSEKVIKLAHERIS